MLSFKIKMTSLTKHSRKENLASENKLSIGRANTTKLKDNTQTYKVNSKRKKPFGMANLTSLRDKRIKPKKTMKMLLSNSSKLWINFKSLKLKTSKSTSIIMDK